MNNLVGDSISLVSPRCRSSLAGPPPRPSYREKLTTQRCIYHPLDQPATLAGSTKVWSHTGIGDNAIGLVLSGHLCSIHVGEHFIYMLFTSLPIFPVHAGLCAPFSRRCLASLRPSLKRRQSPHIHSEKTTRTMCLPPRRPSRARISIAPKRMQLVTQAANPAQGAAV